MPENQDSSGVKVLPTTRMGRWAMWLAIPVVLYPLYWSAALLLPPAAGWLVGVVLTVLVLAALVTGGIAIFLQGEGSGPLKALLSLMVAGVLFFVVGELLFPHWR